MRRLVISVLLGGVCLIAHAATAHGTASATIIRPAIVTHTGAVSVTGEALTTSVVDGIVNFN
jgi:hypothetical protein